MRPSLNVLDPDDIRLVLAEAGRILAEIGIEVRGQALRRLLLARGLPAAQGTGRILFPADAVTQALASAPSRFTLCDRAGQPNAGIGGDRVHFVPGSSALRIQDHRSGRIRPATTADYVEYVRLADSLPHLSYLATAFSTGDIAPQVSDAWRLYLCLANSAKPVVSGAFTEHGVPRMAEMMALFRRDRADLIARPMAIFTITPTGHFRYGEDSCQNLLDCVAWGIPVEIVPVTLMGLTAPVTLPEAAAFHTADVLAGVVMAQLIRPGAPVLFGGAPAAFHMQTAVSPMAAVEAMRLSAACAAVGKALDLPTQAYLALSESKHLDAQAGAETFAGALLAVLAGINSVSGPGMLDYVTTFSLAKLVLDDELCGQALHLARRQPPAREGAALELARELLDEGDLLTAGHTLRHWPQELYLPAAVIDRTSWDQYQRQGTPSLQERAGAEVERILAAPGRQSQGGFGRDAGKTAWQPVETDPAVDLELRRLVAGGLEPGQTLPEVPPWQAVSSPAVASKSRRRARRRVTGND